MNFEGELQIIQTTRNITLQTAIITARSLRVATSLHVPISLDNEQLQSSVLSPQLQMLPLSKPISSMSKSFGTQLPVSCLLTGRRWRIESSNSSLCDG